jgi:tRNA G18 (ribose-2'-O)-methylase SpoU
VKQIIIIAHDMRSTHNVGALLRTAEGLGISHVYFTGYSPYPNHEGDTRLPHESRKLHQQIQKTALGAEETQAWSHHEDIKTLLNTLKADEFTIAALEQTPTSTPLPEFKAPEKLVIILGREVEGLEPDLLKKCDLTLEIPMFGKKESFNVVQAAAMVMYHCRFFD